MLNAYDLIYSTRAKDFAPRKNLTVSEWADQNRILSVKTSPEPGPWRTARNPILKEPMDCLSARSTVQQVIVMFPIQIGKSEILTNSLGYAMEYIKGPIMAAFPAEVSMKKFIQQKWTPLGEETPAVSNLLTTLNSRDASNTKEFKDYLGGQIYFEHAGTPERLKSTSVKTLFVDEYSSFAGNLPAGDDPAVLLDDRTSAYSSSCKKLYVSSPGIIGLCRAVELYEQSDKRVYVMPCPHCSDELNFEWSGLHWNKDGTNVRYVCPYCGAEIEEYQKTDMIKQGRWLATRPEVTNLRGYHCNCLYYQIGLGPRWASMVEMFLKAQDDPAKLKVFINSRLAEGFEDPSMRKVKLNVIADRAEHYPLRVAPIGVGVITAGVDTQDDRLEVQFVGWGKRLAGWVLDYVVIYGNPGDPDGDVWQRLAELINQPFEHVNGHKMPVEATLIDAGGHCTEAVKQFSRSKRVKRCRAIFGAVPKNAPVLSKPKAVDINYRGQSDKRGVFIQHVGTVAIKQMLFARMATDADKQPDQRMLHFSDDLPTEYFSGVVSETFNPRTGRFDKKRGARNEPLDTLVYAYAATHHPELRLQTYTLAKWDEVLTQYGHKITPTEQKNASISSVSLGGINLASWSR